MHRSTKRPLPRRSLLRRETRLRGSRSPAETRLRGSDGPLKLPVQTPIHEVGTLLAGTLLWPFPDGM